MNRTVLITGASAGIGAALARTDAAEGWNVILTARRQGPLQVLADELTAADEAATEALSKITISDLLAENPIALAAYAPHKSCPVAA